MVVEQRHSHAQRARPDAEGALDDRARSPGCTAEDDRDEGAGKNLPSQRLGTVQKPTRTGEVE